MLYEIAVSSAKNLVKKKVISANEQELYEYGLFMIYSYSFFFTITMLLGLWAKIPCESVLFFITFGLIRNYSGGIHANSERKCTIITIIIIMFSVLIIKLIDYFNSYQTSIILVILSIITLVIIPPLDNPNKKLNQMEKLKYHKKVILMTIFFLIVFILLLICGINCMAYALSVGLIFAALLLILGKIVILKNDRQKR